MNTSRICLARRTRGWTQAQFAEKLAIDRTTLSRVETGFVEPGAELKRRIAELLCMGEGDFLFEDRGRSGPAKSDSEERAG